MSGYESGKKKCVRKRGLFLLVRRVGEPLPFLFRAIELNSLIKLKFIIILKILDTSVK